MSRSNVPVERNRRRLFAYLGALVFGLMIIGGVFAKYGWWGFGSSVPGASATKPSLATAPSPTPQLSKSYVYAGSRLLTVEDANANASLPYDLAVWRPSTGTWWVLGGAGSQSTSYQWGAYADKPVPGDFDGDGKTDFSIYRPSTGYWWITRSSDGSTTSTSFGQSADIPAPADYDGDGKTDICLWRPSTYVWYVIPSSTGTSTSSTYGSSSDTPVPADYDGDGRADYAVWRDSNNTFYWLNSE